jgi:hypothetical protein
LRQPLLDNQGHLQSRRHLPVGNRLLQQRRQPRRRLRHQRSRRHQLLLRLARHRSDQLRRWQRRPSHRGLGRRPDPPLSQRQRTSAHHRPCKRRVLDHSSTASLRRLNKGRLGHRAYLELGQCARTAFRQLPLEVHDLGHRALSPVASHRFPRRLYAYSRSWQRRPVPLPTARLEDLLSLRERLPCSNTCNGSDRMRICRWRPRSWPPV